jgi:hypothetical protein
MWRRVLSEQANRPGADVSLLDEALERIQQPDTVTG